LTEAIQFLKKEQSFSSDSPIDPDKLIYPLSISIQTTRNCNLGCIYCSEPPAAGFAGRPSVEELSKMSANLRGVQRVILTGGEPLKRADIFDVISLFDRYPVRALATNATLLDEKLAQQLAECIDYVDITIDGPRRINDKIRGQYDRIIDGAKCLSEAGVEFSVVTVILPQNVESVLYICQIADVLGARKLKILPSIPKGRGQDLRLCQFDSGELVTIFNRIRDEKEKNGWACKITLTDWKRVGVGHALLVHPDGEVVASPVFSNENCAEHVGNILHDDAAVIWKRYSYKANHVQKYLGKTLYIC
jgi:MoaA/NifB/PqqE/SkfB family radical SAM enzyme